MDLGSDSKHYAVASGTVAIFELKSETCRLQSVSGSLTISEFCEDLLVVQGPQVNGNFPYFSDAD
jgi:hypothetical protein